MFKKTVDGVMASFNKAIADLNKVAEDSRHEIQECELSIAAAQEAKRVAEVEQSRAVAIAAKLTALVAA